MLADVADRRHGTVNGYTNQACRCAACKAAWARYKVHFFATRKAKGQCRVCASPVGPSSTVRCETCAANERRYANPAPLVEAGR